MNDICTFIEKIVEWKKGRTNSKYNTLTNRKYKLQNIQNNWVKLFESVDDGTFIFSNAIH